MDDSDEGGLHTFCAVGVPASAWRETFDAIKAWREGLKATDGIYLRKELHATDFVAGRGKVGTKIVFKGRRREIFRDALSTLASLQQLMLFAVANSNQEWAYERLMNRINRTMVAKNSQALIISDQGKEAEYTMLMRRLGVFNPIPSRYGVWAGTQSATRNIPIERIIEDPVFRPSERSYLLQMADFCAFALLRHLRPVTPERKHLGLHTAFPLLEPICFKAANPKHPLGIVV